MARTSFAERWDLDPARREVLSTIIDAVASADLIIANAEAAKAMLLKAAQDNGLEIMAEMGAPSGWVLPVRAIAADIAAATNASDRTIRGRMDDAAVLIEQFPGTFSALVDGRLSRAHATAITDEGLRLTDPSARGRYEQLVLERSAGQSPGRLRVIAKAIAEECEPTTVVERHDVAFADRRSWVEDREDGMGLFCLLTGTAEAHAIQNRGTSMAITVRRARRADAGADDVADERTLDQIRADVLADVMLTGIPSAHVADESGGNALAAIRATVQVTIPATTLTGIGDDAAFLAGHGPIDPETARRLAGGATLWSRLFIDPGTGCLRTVDSYVPTAEQKRFLRARDEHCRFPGCRRSVARCDLDHTIAHAEGGPTAVSNLGALCRSHHLLKHYGNWTAEHGPDGTITWRSPTGRRMQDIPAPVVRFVPTDDVDPPPDPGEPPGF
ncbi:HNH endonuclease signature motif containing protein [Microbacterium rhizophilus]|uniref:HNH endonuclease signature motif containing protein n=1 Tax=Microbacterium rhizophilus TaxID=3138934 RepID=UPI0031F065C5